MTITPRMKYYIEVADYLLDSIIQLFQQKADDIVKQWKIEHGGILFFFSVKSENTLSVRTFLENSAIAKQWKIEHAYYQNRTRLFNTKR